MTLHADDLDPDTRKRLGLGPKRRPSTTRKAAPADPTARYRCSRCGTTIVGYGPAERHARTEHRAARLDLDLSHEPHPQQ